MFHRLLVLIDEDIPGADVPKVFADNVQAAISRPVTGASPM